MKDKSPLERLAAMCLLTGPSVPAAGRNQHPTPGSLASHRPAGLLLPSALAVQHGLGVAPDRLPRDQAARTGHRPFQM